MNHLRILLDEVSNKKKSAEQRGAALRNEARLLRFNNGINALTSAAVSTIDLTLKNQWLIAAGNITALLLDERRQVAADLRATTSLEVAIRTAVEVLGRSRQNHPEVVTLDDNDDIWGDSTEFLNAVIIHFNNDK